MSELRTNLVDDDLEKYGSFLSDDVKVNQEFYDFVMRDVDLTKEDSFLAFDIYQSLNQKVSYDEVFAIFQQDTSLDFIQDIYTKDVEEITEKENSVICTTWANAFAYFLKQAGFLAVVDHGVSHSQVFFKDSYHIFRADATGKMLGMDEKNQMSDLTRAKLGILPQGFLIYEKNKQGLIEEKNFLTSDFYHNHTTMTGPVGMEENTMRILKELKQSEDFYSYPVPEDYQNVFSQIALMSEMISLSQLDIVGGITYLKHLIQVLVPEEEKKKITLDHIKIQPAEEEVLNVDQIKYGLILTYTPEEVENPRCYFFHPSVSGYNFLYTEETGLNPISEDYAFHLQEVHDEIDMKVGDHEYRRGGK